MHDLCAAYIFQANASSSDLIVRRGTRRYMRNSNVHNCLSRDMARNDGASALELHIKVNGQNLSAISERCDIGTLRLPSDPSWPKIPLRRLSDTDNIIKRPCVVTVTGTPRKGRSIVETCQYAKPRLSQKYEVPTHIPKKLSGYNDPRFKRQISREQAEKPDDSRSARNDKQMPEPDTRVLQENKRLRDDSQRTDENANGHTISLCHNVDKLSESLAKLTRETADPAKELPISKTNCCATASQNATNERRDVEGRFPQQEQKQEVNGPLLLMIDEKKLHALPVNVEASSSAQPLQCYSVQIPVVTYCNVPLQIPNVSAQMQEDVRVPYECQSESGKSRGTVGNTAMLTLTNSAYSSKEFRDEKYLLNNIQQRNAKSSDDVSRNQNTSYRDECTFDRIRNRENVNSNISLHRNTVNDILFKSHGNFNATSNVDDAKNGESSDGRLKIVAEKERNTDSCMAIDDCITCGCAERERSSEGKIAENPARPWKRRMKNTRVSISKPPTSVISGKMLQPNLQGLAFGEVKGKEHGRSSNNESKERHGELCVRLKRKTAPMNPSRKAKSFLRKRSRLAIADSDCTLILPGPRRVKGKQCEKTRLKVSQLLHRRSGTSSANPTRVKSGAPGRSRVNSRSLTHLQAGAASFDRSSSIPLETQELLNKSYWEYYKQLALATAGERDGRPSEPRDHLPESQTLRQCSVLSCMINTALRDSTAADGRSSSDPAANATPNVPGNAAGLSSTLEKKEKRRRMRRVSKWLMFALKTIALLSVTIYFAIIFLPVIHDCFFKKEYDDYKNASYVELALQYIASSFGEAFGGIGEVLNTIFLRPVRFDRKL